MKASALALALSCLLSQYLTVAAFADQQYVSETRSSAGTVAANASLPTANLADMHRSRMLSNDACNLLNTAQYEAAESKLKEALAIEPGLPSAHCNLGLLLNKTGRAQEAISHLEYAHLHAPEAPAPLVTLAASYQLCGDLPKAISLYKEYVERFPAAQDRAVIADIVNHLQKESLRSQATGEGSSSNLHWSKKTLKVYVSTGDGITGYRTGFDELLREAFLEWSSGGSLSFEFVNDVQLADIECRWTDDVSRLTSVGEGGEAVLRHRGAVVTHATITLLTNRPANHAKLSDREIKTLCLHEIGHSLGLMNHSPKPDDVMYCTLTSAATPSQHDFTSLQDLYRSPNQ